MNSGVADGLRVKIGKKRRRGGKTGSKGEDSLKKKKPGEKKRGNAREGEGRPLRLDYFCTLGSPFFLLFILFYFQPYLTSS